MSTSVIRQAASDDATDTPEPTARTTAGQLERALLRLSFDQTSSPAPQGEAEASEALEVLGLYLMLRAFYSGELARVVNRSTAGADSR